MKIRTIDAKPLEKTIVIPKDIKLLQKLDKLMLLEIDGQKVLVELKWQEAADQHLSYFGG